MYSKELDTTKSLPHLHRVKGFKYIYIYTNTPSQKESIQKRSSIFERRKRRFIYSFKWSDVRGCSDL